MIGHQNHPEVIGTMGQIKDIFLVENKEDIGFKIPKNQKIAYVTQTTLSVDDTKDIIEAIKSILMMSLEPRKKRYLLCNY